MKMEKLFRHFYLFSKYEGEEEKVISILQKGVSFESRKRKERKKCSGKSAGFFVLF